LLSNIKRIMSLSNQDFSSIEPYPDKEINKALKRITASKEFSAIASFVFPEKSINEVAKLINNIYSADEFQKVFMHRAVRRVIETSATQLSFDGFEKLRPEMAYLFVANHRDIVLDSAILQALLVEHNFPTTEISFGSNLAISPFIIDFSKVNKMFMVFRGGTRLEMINNTKQLSAYIRQTLCSKKNSIWIAQRNGRTKNGHDTTEDALLKMFNISGQGTFLENFRELNIVPLSISYEYEPCGTLKVNELYKSLNGVYKKSPQEDFNSIITGFTQAKGNIHLSVGDPVNNTLEASFLDECYNENIKKLSRVIDNSIYKNYKLYKNNYIAYDILHESTEFNHFYNLKDKEIFNNFVQKEILSIYGDKDIIEKLYLELYANPLKNKIKIV